MCWINICIKSVYVKYLYIYIYSKTIHVWYVYIYVIITTRMCTCIYTYVYICIVYQFKYFYINIEFGNRQVTMRTSSACNAPSHLNLHARLRESPRDMFTRKDQIIFKHWEIKEHTLWPFNMASENGHLYPFIEDFPIKHGDFP